MTKTFVLYLYVTMPSTCVFNAIQVRHKPTIPLPLPGRKMEGKKSEETLQIRLYAVDCPEVAHFGNPAQPLSAEAKEVNLLSLTERSFCFFGKVEIFRFAVDF